MREADAIFQLQMEVAMQIVFGFALGCIKISICLQLHRIFWINRLFSIVSSLAAILSFIWASATAIISFTLCRPIAYNWDPSIPGTCGNFAAAYLATGVCDVAIDVLIFLPPIPLLYSLKIATGEKIATIGIFMLGLLTIVVGIIRTITSVQVGSANDDDTGIFISAHIFCISELCVATVVASLLVMRPLMVLAYDAVSSFKMRSRWFGTPRWTVSRVIRDSERVDSGKEDSFKETEARPTSASVDKSALF
jgi:hypothetical protein